MIKGNKKTRPKRVSCPIAMCVPRKTDAQFLSQFRPSGLKYFRRNRTSTNIIYAIIIIQASKKGNIKPYLLIFSAKIFNFFAFAKKEILKNKYYTITPDKWHEKAPVRYIRAGASL